eukprot:TRINITY_DN1388_c0_g1_i11.p1 TRINITY_DN1388_c0_g1~~TRINITY_DN1388_c0_g1_i11.p1  ORF type:complete len:290 (+),score=66.77 TRINITY_DN1388_c0_g1_i11:312-1181(+)
MPFSPRPIISPQHSTFEETDSPTTMKQTEAIRHSDLFFTNWNKLLATSEGRDRFLKLLQSTCHLLAASMDYARHPFTWSLQLRLLKGQEAFSNVRKAFCLFDFGADVEKLLAALKQGRFLTEPLDSISIVCSLWTNLCDHYVWVVRNGMLSASEASIKDLLRIRDWVALTKVLAILSILASVALRSLRVPTSARDYYIPSRIGSYKTLPPQLDAQETMDEHNRNSHFVRVPSGMWLHPLLRLRITEQIFALAIALHNVRIRTLPSIVLALLGVTTCTISVYLRWPRDAR